MQWRPKRITILNKGIHDILVGYTEYTHHVMSRHIELAVIRTR